MKNNSLCTWKVITFFEKKHKVYFTMLKIGALSLTQLVEK